MLQKFPHFREALVVPLCAVLLLAQLACTQLRVRQGPSPTAPPSTEAQPLIQAQPVYSDATGVSFNAFRFETDEGQQRLFEGDVVSQLWIERGGRWELVHRDRVATWSRTDLIPGKYLLEIIEISEKGNAYPPNEDKVVTFELDANTTADVRLVVKKVPWGTVAIVALSVVVVVGLIVAVILLGDDAPKPRGRTSRSVNGSRSNFSLPPPPRAPQNPRPGMGHTVHFVAPRIYTSVNLFFPIDEPIVYWQDDYWQNGSYAGDALPADRPRLLEMRLPTPDRPDGELRVQFDREMNPSTIAPGALVVLDARGQVIPGGVYMESGNRVAVYHPLRPLPPGQYRFLVRGAYLYDMEWKALEKTFERGFSIGTGQTPDAGDGLRGEPSSTQGVMPPLAPSGLQGDPPPPVP